MASAYSLAPVSLMALVVLLKIPLPVYFEYTHYLVALLAPATIAFALPIYRERQLIRQYPLTIGFGVLSGLTLGLLSTWVLVQLIDCHLIYRTAFWCALYQRPLLWLRHLPLVVCLN